MRIIQAQILKKILAKRGRNSRTIRRLELQLERLVAAALKRQGEQIIGKLGAAGIKKKSIDDAFSDFDADELAIIAEYNQEAFIEGAKQLARDIKFREGLKVVPKLAAEYARKLAGTRIRDINQTTLDDIRRILSNAIESGRQYEQVAQEIRNYVSSPHRPRLIATNEMGAAYIDGNARMSEAASTILDVKMEKFWSTTGDDRVTDGCLENEAEGWVDDDFEYNGGGVSADAPPRFPGCRCDILRRIKE